MVRPSETRNQTARRLLGSRLNKDWPNTRDHLQPRGLQNGPGAGIIAACYRSSTLQMLAHLPKFVNWVAQHNDPTYGQDWPCHADDANRRLPINQENDQAILDMDQNLIIGCVPCRLKAFFQQYWAKETIGSNGLPMAFPYNHASIMPLHSLAERWMCRLPDSLSEKDKLPGETDAAFATRRLAKETKAQRKERVSFARGQSCADEFMGFLRAGIVDSIDPTNDRRMNEYRALFMLQRHEETRCSFCNHICGVAPYPTTEEIGFPNIKPLITGPDNLYDALARSIWLAPDTNNSIECTQCKQKQMFTTRQIEAAPEYLRIHLDLSASTYPVLSLEKNRTPISIPDTLDLTHHTYVPIPGCEPWPLRYKLISVLYHRGPAVTGGHWTAGVSHPVLKPRRGKKDVAAPSANYYFCDDDTIAEWDAKTGKNPLTTNPELGSGMEDNAVVVMYQRLPRVAPKKDYTTELTTGLSVKHYDVGNDEEGKLDNDSKKRKDRDDGEERGLRRSKRLREKNS